MKLIEYIQESDRTAWQEFVENHPSGSYFQTPDFYDLLADDNFYQPVFIGIKNEGNEFLAVLLGITINEYQGLKRKFASRTVIYGGPLIHPGSEDPGELAGLVLDALVKKVSRSSLFIEFRNLQDTSAFKHTFELHGFRFHEHLNLVIQTNDRDKVQSEISKSKLRQVRKSLESGARIVKANSPEEIEGLYHLLKDLYRNRVRKPLPPLGFFQKFQASVKAGKPGVILLVKYREKIVAGIVCPVTPGRTLHEWYVCGLDREYNEIFPSVLATWGAIDYAAQNGLPEFDFMGLGRPGRAYGVRDFKMRFGGDQVNWGRYTRINNKFLFLVAKAGYHLLSIFKKV